MTARKKSGKRTPPKQEPQPIVLDVEAPNPPSSPPSPPSADQEEDGEDLGRMTVYEVKLTRMELAHLRDLFSVKLPPEMTTTLSEALAESQQRPFVETKLWQKLTRIMHEAGVPMEDEAPDFTILPTGPAPMGVFQVEATDNQIKDMILTAVGQDQDEDQSEEDE